ncbi:MULTISPECIES: copper-binding protein [Halomonadaceae]|jgi:Cu(I)/Ag(I) efflux system protein CusF|uniref:Copper-binding protein n=5 Tax=Vreelandella TaxID=3137766 RepID=A0A433KH76_9GAMM|nr:MULTISPECIES: copper-binding protein [Halomonas]AJY52962.1 Copper binding periplasmic protein CusF [Halomonas sp. KO116]NVF16478.1 copper-binding protein [Halomonas maris]RUR28576.1 copper-binding protein [Halomonas nanhaiensis]|tara:strand:- start:2075 stop:2431 length:357 start_codon:yes stop_codon:yes gene_type:complete
MRTKLALMITLAIAPAAFAGDMNAMEHDQDTAMDNMQMDQNDAAAEIAKAAGTIRKINMEKGTVTIAHGPVPELEWPAMTMGFKATPEQLMNLKEGDEVEFEFTSKGMDSVITSINSD